MMKPESIQISQENKDLGFETNEIGRIYYYNESHKEIRQYLQQQRLIDVEMQRRSDETESRSIEEPKVKQETEQELTLLIQTCDALTLPTPDMRLSDSGRRSDERTDGIQKTEPSSLPEKKDKEDSVLRITEADQIRDYKHSNADTRENLQQYRRLRDVEMQRRRRETESRFWHQERDRSPDRRGSESRLRFDERAPDWRESESRWRFYERGPDWRRSEPRLRFDERTPDWRGSETQWIFDEKTQRRQELVRSGEECWCRQCCNHPTQLSQARSTDWRASESESRFDERTQRRYEREYSGFRPEKRLLVHSQSKIIPDSRVRDPRRHDTEWRFERERMEQIERQRREARYNLQEQRSRGEVKDYSHLIDPIGRGNMQARREAQVREQRQRDSIERAEERGSRESATRPDSVSSQWEMPENQNVDAHHQQNTQELGFKRKEGDGVFR